MIRILIFLLTIVLFAGSITYFASLDSRIVGEAFGYRFDGPSGLIVGALFAAFLLVIYATHKFKDIMALPGKIKARDKEVRRGRGIAALTRGLEAVAVGDAADAAHHAKVAQRHLDDLALTRLLGAQAAHLSGDEAAARQAYTAMLEAPETEFLGLKGLYLQAMAKGDLAMARKHAERAFGLRSNARWAFDSVIELGLERGAWGEARDAIARGRRNNLIAADKADRATAALLTADAYAAFLSDDKKTALTDVEAALKLAPSFAPAAVLAARLDSDAGKTGKAAKIIELAFTAQAHPAYVQIYDKLYTDESAEKRAEHLRKLAAKNPSCREAKLLQARADNLLGEWTSAIKALEPLLTDAPTALEYSLMASAVAGLGGKDEARIWLERAAAAPRDPRPGAEGEFHFTREGWARLVRDYMDFARLAPPPLEDIAAGVSAEEIRLLTAPKAPAPMPDTPPVQDENEEITQENSASKPATPTGEPAPEPSQDKGDLMVDDEDVERIAAEARKVS
jgi:HemY protein